MKSLSASLKKVFIPLFFITASVSFCESFRVAKMHELTLPSDYSSSGPVYSGIFDGVCIRLPDEKTFITGIELNIKIPESVAQWRDTVAYLFYNDITPLPSQNTIDYSGNRISINTIPGKLNHTVYIPLSRKFNLKESPYAKILETRPDVKDNCIFFRFILAMKGAPESLERAQFEITAKPVLSDEGSFSLTVEQPQGKKENFAVYIDDHMISGKTEGLILKEGEHRLSITSEAYRDEVRTFIVEQAKKTKLNVILRGIEPVIKIISPENAKVYYDSKLLTSIKESFITTAGNHTVKFVIGDYEVIKNINALNGRTYTVNLTVDASVSEEE